MNKLKLLSIPALILLGLTLGSINIKKDVASDFVVDVIKTSYAQTMPTPSPSPAATIAAEMAELPEPPAEKLVWVQMMIDLVASTPWAGKYLAILFSIIAIISTVATMLASMLMALKIAMDKMGKTVPFMAVAAKYVGAAMKWAAYLSMYNVQKK